MHLRQELARTERNAPRRSAGGLRSPQPAPPAPQRTPASLRGKSPSRRPAPTLVAHWHPGSFEEFPRALPRRRPIKYIPSRVGQQDPDHLPLRRSRCTAFRTPSLHPPQAPWFDDGRKNEHVNRAVMEGQPALVDKAFPVDSLHPLRAGELAQLLIERPGADDDQMMAIARESRIDAACKPRGRSIEERHVNSWLHAPSPEEFPLPISPASCPAQRAGCLQKASP